MFQHPEWTIPSFAPLVDKNGLALPDLYEHVMRVLVIADNITGILIQDPSLSKPKETLVTIQKELSEFYGELPTDLRFQASTLQVYASIAQGAAFVLLHVSTRLVCHGSMTDGYRSGFMRGSRCLGCLLTYSLIILSYCPNLLVGDTLEDKEDATERASIEVAASSAKSILDIMSFAELVGVVTLGRADVRLTPKQSVSHGSITLSIWRDALSVSCSSGRSRVHTHGSDQMLSSCRKRQTGYSLCDRRPSSYSSSSQARLSPCHFHVSHGGKVLEGGTVHHPRTRSKSRGHSACRHCR